MREFLSFASPDVQEIITANFYTDSESESEAGSTYTESDNSDDETFFTVPVTKAVPPPMNARRKPAVANKPLRQQEAAKEAPPVKSAPNKKMSGLAKLFGGVSGLLKAKASPMKVTGKEGKLPKPAPLKAVFLSSQSKSEADHPSFSLPNNDISPSQFQF